MAENAWIIAALPLAAFLLIGAGVRRYPIASGWLTVATIGLATALALLVLSQVAAGTRVERSWSWLPLASGPTLTLGLQVDPLTATMLVVVTTVSLLVQVYSVGYMQGDPGYARYFAFMALFTFSMLGLVLANNLLALYIFWELVGLCSYLLIGHWHERPQAAAAAKKAFIVTRFGDFGFLVGILFLYGHTGTLQISALVEAVGSGQLKDPALTVGMLLVFCGAIGKSAQFPLHVWLPDAMEGPTPVSALIHAATMVAAGVYLMARLFPMLEQSATAMLVVASIGAFTALFAATMGLVDTDIKRVLAYSTVSQLGYMMLAIGMGSMAAGIFHLVNHAYFKALLFLCAGSVIHLASTNDLLQMGGLRRQRRLAFVAMTVAALSLAGLFPLSGFWSKDEILAIATRAPLLFLAALLTVFLTTAYMFRVIFLTFPGIRRGPVHEHREPPTMALPIAALVIPSVATGVLGFPGLGNPLGSFLAGHPAPVEMNSLIVLLATALALTGIGVAWAFYGGGRLEPAAQVVARFRPAYLCLVNRYYMDHLYNWMVGRLVLGIGWLADRFDGLVVDGAANGLGTGAVALGGSLRRLQSGQVQAYAWALFAGVIVLVVAGLPWVLAGRG